MRWILSLLVFVPSALFADGGIFYPPSPEIELWERNQLAILKHSGDTEELSIVVRLEGNTNDFAWIIPVPSQPSVESESHEVFDELAYLSRPIYRDRGMDCACNRAPGWGPGGYDEGGQAGEGPEDGVDIVGEGTVGFLHYLILRATDPQVLRDSLEAWGYEYPEEAESLFGYYVEKGWEYFVASRVDTSASSRSARYYYGYLQPIKLCFQSPEPVYPLKISSLSSQESEVILYVVAEHRMTFDRSTVRYADKITSEELDFMREHYPHLEGLFERSRFITKLERWFDRVEMEDITLEEADDDLEHREIIFTGIPGEGMVFASILCLVALWSIRKGRADRGTSSKAPVTGLRPRP